MDSLSIILSILIPFLGWILGVLEHIRRKVNEIERRLTILETRNRYYNDFFVEKLKELSRKQ